MTSNLQILQVSLLVLVHLMQHSDAACPSKNQIRTRASGTIGFLSSRSHGQSCCTSGRRRTALFQCQCASGLQCCRNFQNQLVCVGSSSRRGQSNSRNRNNNGNRNPTGGALGSLFSTGGNSWITNLLCTENQCGPGGECGTVGGAVTCSCFKGFVNAPNTKRCVPKPEPATPRTTTTTTTTTSRPLVESGGVSVVPIDISGGQLSTSDDARCIAKCGSVTGCSVSKRVVFCPCNPEFILDNRSFLCTNKACALNPCGLDEECAPTGIDNERTCICQNGFTNTPDGSCIANPCVPNPCQIGGQICTATDTGLANCSCAPGFVISDDSCVGHDPCLSSPCGANTNCFNDVFTGAAKCECLTGFISSINNSCVDNPCAPNPCLISGQICTSTELGVANCSCAPGLVVVGDTCVEIDPCSSSPCGANTNCVTETFTSTAKCECLAGFIRSTDITCIAHPCEPNPCGTNGVCLRVGVDNRQCICISGSVLHKDVCIENPCEPNPCGDGGICSLTDSGVTNCSCIDNFTLAADGSCEAISVIDVTTTTEPIVEVRVDPCRPNPCGPLVNCVLNATTSTPLCVCSNGKLVQPGGNCVLVSVDPCIPNPCGNRGACSKFNGQVSCQCRVGSSIQTDGTCSDNTPSSSIPCSGGNPCGVGTCSLVLGQKVCKCPSGFKKFNSTCVLSEPCDPLTTLSTLDLGEEGNKTIPAGATTGCLKSRNYGSGLYPPNLFDEVTLTNNGHTTLIIIIEHLETQPKQNTPFLKVNTCGTDFFFASGQLFCGFITKTHRPDIRRINVADLDKIVIGFVSTANDNFEGFLIRWILSS